MRTLKNRGSIIERGNTYLIKLGIGKDSSGRYRYHYETARSSAQAHQRLTELLRQRDTGAYSQPGKLTVAEFLTHWLAEYTKPNLSPRGYERYASVCRLHLIPAIGNIRLTQLRPEHLQKLYSDKLKGGLMPRSVRYIHVILHKALATAIKWGLIARNVADGADIPKAHPGEMQTYDEIELNKFLEAAKGTQYYPLFYTALFTGMRRSELLALRWQDIDLVYGQVYVNRSLHQLKDNSFVFTQPKTAKSRRTIALPPSAFLVLESWRKAKEVEAGMLGTTLKDSDLIFNNLGKPLRPATVTRAWSMLAVKAGVKHIRLHDARHTHASLMLKQGIHPKVVQERLGHSTIAITLDTYSHVAPGLQEAAAKRFDEIARVKDNISVP